MKKYYITNGFNKRVLMAKSPLAAATFQLKEIIKGAVINKGDNIGMEKCELYPFSVVSEYGFLQDIIAQGEETDQLDNCAIFKTTVILNKIGRKDMAKGMASFEKKLPKEMKRLLAEMTV